MLKVELDHILSEEDAAQKILDIFGEVERTGEGYVVMSNGHPVVAIVTPDQVGGAVESATAPVEESANDIAEPVTPAPAPEPVSEPAPALPEMPPMPDDEVTQSLPPLPEPPAAPLPPLPEPPIAPTPPPMPSFSGNPYPSYPGGSSPLSEEPPAETEGPLIPQIPVIQQNPNPTPTAAPLPPLSGTENLQSGGGQSYGVPNVPRP